VIIENFFPLETFEKIKEEYEQIYQNKNNVRSVCSGPCLMKEIDLSDANRIKVPTINQKIFHSTTLRSIIENALKKKIRIPPACILQWSQQAQEQDIKESRIHCREDLDSENIIHQDHIFPIYKAWYYVNDVNKNNGAFIYMPNSHTINWERLKHEYKRSIYWDLLNQGKSNEIHNDMFKEGRVVVSPETCKNMNISEKSLEASANSLVIANTMGFHRRGKFYTNTPRKIVHIDFRRALYPLNSVPFINYLNGIDGILLKNRRKDAAYVK